jgi:hypothetical protein
MRHLIDGVEEVTVDEQAFFFQGGADTQRLIEEQQLARDARFLLDSGFQAPRSVRLGSRCRSDGDEAARARNVPSLSPLESPAVNC